jgi:hypothetical protein
MGKARIPHRYVLKPTDEWHADKGEHGLIWSGRRNRYKTRQYPDREIVATDGVTVLREVLSIAAPEPEPEAVLRSPAGLDAAEARNSMPVWDDMSPDEKHLARFAVGVARAGGAMFVGRAIECQVARLLGATMPAFGTSPWDVRFGDIDIEVKSAGIDQAFSLKKADPGAVQVWVLVRKLDGYREAQYFVLSSSEVAALGKKTVLADDLADFGPFDNIELAAKVKAAAAR